MTAMETPATLSSTAQHAHPTGPANANSNKPPPPAASSRRQGGRGHRSTPEERLQHKMRQSNNRASPGPPRTNPAAVARGGQGTPEERLQAKMRQSDLSNPSRQRQGGGVGSSHINSSMISSSRQAGAGPGGRGTPEERLQAKMVQGSISMNSSSVRNSSVGPQQQQHQEQHVGASNMATTTTQQQRWQQRERLMREKMAQGAGGAAPVAEAEAAASSKSRPGQPPAAAAAAARSNPASKSSSAPKTAARLDRTLTPDERRQEKLRRQRGEGGSDVVPSSSREAGVEDDDVNHNNHHRYDRQETATSSSNAAMSIHEKNAIRVELGVGAVPIDGPGGRADEDYYNDDDEQEDHQSVSMVYRDATGVPVEPVSGAVRLEGNYVIAEQRQESDDDRNYYNNDEEDAIREAKDVPWALCVICGVPVTIRRCLTITVPLVVVVGVLAGVLAAMGAFGGGGRSTSGNSGGTSSAGGGGGGGPDFGAVRPPPTLAPTPSPTVYVPPECRQRKLPRDDDDDDGGGGGGDDVVGTLLTEDENYGRSVAIDGNTAVVGADNVLPQNSEKQPRSGTVYVYTMDRNLDDGEDASSASTPLWTEQARLQSDDNARGDRFGRSVAVNGDTVAVGAVDTENRLYESGLGVGCVYVFARSSGSGAGASGTAVWTQQAKLLPDDASDADVAFASSIAVFGDTIVVGMDFVGARFVSGTNSGLAYVYTRSGSGDEAEWTQTAKIIPRDGQENDRFGHSVALYEDTVVIGAPKADASETNSGAAYVYVRTDGRRWKLQDKLLPDDGGGGPAANDAFGTSVAIHGNTAVVGAASYNGNYLDSGAAYVFARGVTAEGKWAQQAKLVARDAKQGDSFGQSVAVDGGTIAVGSRRSSVYVFGRHARTAWEQKTKIVPSTHQAKPNAEGSAASSTDPTEDKYGESIGLDGVTVIIGAHGDNERGANSGSAYAINLC